MPMVENVFGKDKKTQIVEINGIKYRLEFSIKFYVMEFKPGRAAGRPLISASYKLYDMDTNEYVGNLYFNSNDLGLSFEMGYNTAEKYRGNRIAPCLAKIALADIYEKEITHKSFCDGEHEFKKCQDVFLAIHQDNKSSLSVAKRLDFKITQDNAKNYVAHMERDRYLHLLKNANSTTIV